MENSTTLFCSSELPWAGERFSSKLKKKKFWHAPPKILAISDLGLYFRDYYVP